jgi:hypothetical protein
MLIALTALPSATNSPCHCRLSSGPHASCCECRGPVIRQCPLLGRTYLPSSPILCVLNALSFLLRISLSPLFLPISLLRALRTTIRERYKDAEEDEDIQSLEIPTQLRWVFSIVGTATLSVKLMAMDGVPWTKTWGVMFLYAFSIFKTAALIVEEPDTAPVDSPLQSISNDSTSPPGKISTHPMIGID